MAAGFVLVAVGAIGSSGFGAELGASAGAASEPGAEAGGAGLRDRGVTAQCPPAQRRQPGPSTRGLSSGIGGPAAARTRSATRRRSRSRGSRRRTAAGRRPVRDGRPAPPVAGGAGRWASGSCWRGSTCASRSSPRRLSRLASLGQPPRDDRGDQHQQHHDPGQHGRPAAVAESSARRGPWAADGGS